MAENINRPPSFFLGCDIRNLALERGQADPYIGHVNEWPAHITLIPPVNELEGQLPEDVFAEFALIARNTQPIQVKPVRDALFGHDGDTAVTIVDGLRVLHLALIGALDSYDYADAFDRTYAGRRYNAHTSHLPGGLAMQDAIVLDSMSIFRKTSDGRKRIQERLKFGQ